jgi:uncharacterized protein (TIGR02145 family)
MKFQVLHICILFTVICSGIYAQNGDKYKSYSQEVNKNSIFFDDFQYDDFQYTSKYEPQNDNNTYGKRHYTFYELSSRSYNEESFLLLNEFLDQKRDFEIEISLMIVFSDELNPNGIALGINDQKEALKFAISKNGYFQIYKETKDKLIYIKPWTLFKDFKSGYNKLTVRKIDGVFYYFINKTYVYSSPFEPLSGNRIGIFVCNKSNIRISEIHFSYFSNNLTSNKEISIQENSTNQQVKTSSILTLNWQNENARYKTDIDGLDLNFAEKILEWKTFCEKDQPAYCYYNFDETNSSFGLIYNYAAVRVLAPEGYRIPSKKDYELLLEELKKNKRTNTLCSIIPTSDCNICYSCTANDYNAQLNFNLKPFGWLSISKSKKDKWKENGEDMYLWTMETERKNSVLSGLGFAQFKSPSTIKTVDLNEINNVGAKGENVKNKDDFEFIEKYYGTFVRFIKN